MPSTSGRRVGLRVPQALRLGQRLLIAPAVPRHRGQHEVRGAVDDAHDSGDLVRQQVAVERADDSGCRRPRRPRRAAARRSPPPSRAAPRRAWRSPPCWPSPRACRSPAPPRCTRAPAPRRPSARSRSASARPRAPPWMSVVSCSGRTPARARAASRTSTRRSSSCRPAFSARRSRPACSAPITPPPTLPAPSSATPIGCVLTSRLPPTSPAHATAPTRGR